MKYIFLNFLFLFNFNVFLSGKTIKSSEMNTPAVIPRNESSISKNKNNILKDKLNYKFNIKFFTENIKNIELFFNINLNESEETFKLTKKKNRLIRTDLLIEKLNYYFLIQENGILKEKINKNNN